MICNLKFIIFYTKVNLNPYIYVTRVHFNGFMIFIIVFINYVIQLHSWSPPLPAFKKKNQQNLKKGASR